VKPIKEYANNLNTAIIITKHVRLDQEALYNFVPGFMWMYPCRSGPCHHNDFDRHHLRANRSIFHP
jgi:hypothetical protein